MNATIRVRLTRIVVKPRWRLVLQHVIFHGPKRLLWEDTDRKGRDPHDQLAGAAVRGNRLKLDTFAHRQRRSC